MKLFIFLLMFSCAGFSANAQTTELNAASAVKSDIQIVEASCGECKFGMAGTGCQLAVRIDGKPYFVDGAAIDKHGDAHTSTGFCNAIRKAEVKGNIVDNRFVAQSFKLLTAEAKKL